MPCPLIDEAMQISRPQRLGERETRVVELALLPNLERLATRMIERHRIGVADMLPAIDVAQLVPAAAISDDQPQAASVEIFAGAGIGDERLKEETAKAEGSHF